MMNRKRSLDEDRERDAKRQKHLGAILRRLGLPEPVDPEKLIQKLMITDSRGEKRPLRDVASKILALVPDVDKLRKLCNSDPAIQRLCSTNATILQRLKDAEKSLIVTIENYPKKYRLVETHILDPLIEDNDHYRGSIFYLKVNDKLYFFKRKNITDPLQGFVLFSNLFIETQYYHHMRDIDYPFWREFKLSSANPFVKIYTGPSNTIELLLIGKLNFLVPVEIAFDNSIFNINDFHYIDHGFLDDMKKIDYNPDNDDLFLINFLQEFYNVSTKTVEMYVVTDKV